MIYTRKSSDEGLEQEFNTLDAQREACEAYIVLDDRACEHVRRRRPVRRHDGAASTQAGVVTRRGEVPFLQQGM
jgi:hypothetical protein